MRLWRSGGVKAVDRSLLGWLCDLRNCKDPGQSGAADGLEGGVDPGWVRKERGFQR